MLDRFKGIFSEARWTEICNLVREKGMRISYNDFTSSEIDCIINETPLSFNQAEGARMYYIKKCKLREIANTLNYSDSNIKYYKKKVSKALRTTCCRIFK